MNTLNACDGYKIGLIAIITRFRVSAYNVTCTMWSIIVLLCLFGQLLACVKAPTLDWTPLGIDCVDRQSQLDHNRRTDGRLVYLVKVYEIYI